MPEKKPSGRLAPAGTRTISRRTSILSESGRTSRDSQRETTRLSGRGTAVQGLRRRRRKKKEVEVEPKKETAADLIKRLAVEAAERARERETVLLEKDEEYEDADEVEGEVEEGDETEEVEGAKAGSPGSEAAAQGAAAAPSSEGNGSLTLTPESPKGAEPQTEAASALAKAQDPATALAGGSVPSPATAGAPAPEAGAVPPAAPVSVRWRRAKWALALTGGLVLVLSGWLMYRSLRLGALPDLAQAEERSALLSDLGTDVCSLGGGIAEAGGWIWDGVKDLFSESPQAHAQAQERAQTQQRHQQTVVHSTAAESRLAAEALAKAERARQARLRQSSSRSAPYSRGSGSRYSAPARSSGSSGRDHDMVGPRPIPSGPMPAGLAEAKQCLDQAMTYYENSDPRRSSFQEIQANIRKAKPLFERCLDACGQARSRGVQGAEVDGLEQAATMRLYDCNKRMTVTGP